MHSDQLWQDRLHCLDPNTVQAFAAGLLGAAEDAATRRHVEGCGECRHLVAVAVKLEPVSLDPDLTAGESRRSFRSVKVVIPSGLDFRSREPIDDSDGLAYGHMVGKFRVIRKLGEGGMGQVYLARDTELGRNVALKIVHPQCLDSEEDRQRFLLEARTTARFNHPRIVTIYEVGQHDGSPYLALELLDGQALRLHLKEKRLSVAEATRIGHAIADALCEAHRHKVLHRDLKPDNVFLCTDGGVRVLDFGLAASTNTGLSDLSMPGTRAVRGTFTYLAPEQWAKKPCNDRTDIWSLGVILYELFVGRYPFDCSSPDALCQQVTGAVPTLAFDDLPQDLVALIKRCLDTDRDARPSSAEVERQLGQQLAELRQPSAERCPFLGLGSFAEQHRRSYFGRSVEIAALINCLREQPLVPVLGASGVGKSSLISAGLIPRLREQGPLVVLKMRPGKRPFLALARQLARASAGGHVSEARVAALMAEVEAAPSRLALRLAALAEDKQSVVLLLVDQLEELFSLVPSEAVRRRFLRAVAAAADDRCSPVRVVIAAREEFLTRLAVEPEIRQALGHSVVLGVPDAGDLEDILTHQAAAVGYRFDDGLVEEMAAAAAGTPACLPLLQFCGERLWERRDVQRRIFTRASYEQQGQIGGTLARHADGVLAGLTDEQTRSARALLLRLVTREGTGRVLSGDRLLDGLPDAAEVLERLVNARLLVARRKEQDGTDDRAPGSSRSWSNLEIELVHESLVTMWSTLAGWIDNDREDLRALREIEAAAKLWTQRGRSDREVWRGDALRDGLRTVERTSVAVGSEALRFLAAGRAQQRRKTWRQRAVIGVGFLLLAGVALFFFVQERAMYRQKEREVVVRAMAFEEGALAALGRGDLGEARAKLRLSLETSDSQSARILWERTRQTEKLWERRFDEYVYQSAWSPDGRLLTVGGSRHVIYLIDSETWRVRKVLRGHNKDVIRQVFSPNGRHLASQSPDEAWLWDARRMTRTHVIANTKQTSPGNMLFCDEGRLLARVAGGNRIQLIDVATSRSQGEIPVEGVSFLATDRTGQRLAASGSERQISIWNVASKKRIKILEGDRKTKGYSQVAMSPNGRQVLAIARDGRVLVWDLAHRRPSRVIPGPWFSLDFSANGKRFALAGRGRIQVWTAADVEIYTTLRTGQDEAAIISFSPGGDRIAALFSYHTATVWRVDRRQPALPSHDGGAHGVDYSPDGRSIVTCGDDSTVRLWDASSGKRLRILPGRGLHIRDVKFSPDGKSIVAGGEKTLFVWDIASGRKRAENNTVPMITRIAYSPDGQRIATVGFDGLRLWNASTLSAPLHKEKKGQWLRSLAFTPDGAHLAVAGFDQKVRLLNARTGEEVRTIGRLGGYVWGLAFDSARRLHAVDSTGLLARWDLGGDGARSALRKPTAVDLWSVAAHGESIGICGVDGAEIHTGSSIQRLRGHRGDVNDLAFAPNGKRAATVGSDGTLRTWDLKSGRQVWRAPLVRGSPATLLTHRGWESLDPQGSTESRPRRRWELAAERRALSAVLSKNENRLCMLIPGAKLELWDIAADRRVKTFALQVPQPELVPLPNGCAVIAEQQVWLLADSGPVRLSLKGARAATSDGDQVLAANDQEIAVFTSSGQKLGSMIPVDAGVTSILKVDASRVLLGYEEGSLELRYLNAQTNAQTTKLLFQQTPTGVPLRLLQVTDAIVAVGYSTGVVGIWDLASGRRLQLWRRHGPVVHLLHRDGFLYGATELGEYGRWDLSVLSIGYCRLLRRVWQQVTVFWDGGRVQRRPPPQNHHCNREEP